MLADETLLVPVLYALDESVTDLNVTMGLSLRSSLLFTLIDTLFEMQRTVHEFRTKDGRDLRIPKFHHRHVVKVLNHPFVKQYERIRGLTWPGDVLESGEVLPPEPLFQWMAKTIVKEQRVYLTETELQAFGQDDPLVQVLFARWPEDTPMKAIRTFYKLIDLLRDVYKTSQDAIEIEYLYLFYTLLQQLEATMERQERGGGQRAKGEGVSAAGIEHRGGQTEINFTSLTGSPQPHALSPSPIAPVVTVRSFRQFLNELIRQTSIPFTSEGKSQLQIMGMLETRALDFDRVIILSVNEGILPLSRKLNSLIPFDIANELNLPTYREQGGCDGLPFLPAATTGERYCAVAYHLYRCLWQQQRRDEQVYSSTRTRTRSPRQWSYPNQLPGGTVWRDPCRPAAPY